MQKEVEESMKKFAEKKKKDGQRKDRKENKINIKVENRGVHF